MPIALQKILNFTTRVCPSVSGRSAAILIGVAGSETSLIFILLAYFSLILENDLNIFILEDKMLNGSFVRAGVPFLWPYTRWGQRSKA